MPETAGLSAALWEIPGSPAGFPKAPVKPEVFMKRTLAALFTGLVLISCASREVLETESPPPAGLTLDEAVADIAAYFIARLPEGARTAIAAFDSGTPGLSGYVSGELWNRFEDSGKFIMVDRQNLERIAAEVNYQLGSGAVDDSLAVSITRQYGADTLIFGRIIPMGGEYRITAYATDVEKAASSQRSLTIRPDSRLASLLNASLDEQIEQAVGIMAGKVERKTTIAIGRIGFAGTQSVSSLSAYLKNAIISGALKHPGAFAVASDSESAGLAVATRGLTVEGSGTGSSVQAVVLGSFSPVDNGARISLRLVSIQDSLVLSAADFVVPAAELDRLRLSMLPERDSSAISMDEFEAKQKTLDPYAGRNNGFVFTVSPDDLDGIYYDGEYMSMRIYSERDCYFRVIQVDVNGTVQLIYPATARDNNFIRAGETRRIPDNTRYRMRAPYGEEYILAAAYDNPFAAVNFDGGSLSDPVISRGLTVEQEGGSPPMSPVATAKFNYTILPAP
jgi:hypothetical protein